MTWSLSASGHNEDAGKQDELAARLGKVLADAGADVTSATFNSSSFSGDPRDHPSAGKHAAK